MSQIRILRKVLGELDRDDLEMYSLSIGLLATRLSVTLQEKDNGNLPEVFPTSLGFTQNEATHLSDITRYVEKRIHVLQVESN